MKRGVKLPGAIIDIEGTKYIVLEEREGYQALVMTTSSVGYKYFQLNFDWNTKLRPDGQNANTYEGSEIDNYLENEWYNGLSSTMKTAIRTTNIKQASYASVNNPNFKQETGPNGQVYNTIRRHVFLPSVSEIEKVVDLMNKDKVNAFLNGNSTWTRDSNQKFAYCVQRLLQGNGCMSHWYVNSKFDVRPAFVIDLSQVDYKVIGHTDYK